MYMSNDLKKIREELLKLLQDKYPDLKDLVKISVVRKKQKKNK